MSKRRKPQSRVPGDAVQAKPLQVSLKECKGNPHRMGKRFKRAVIKEGVVYQHRKSLRGPVTKGQRNRKKRLRKAWLQKKAQEEL